MLQFRHLPTVGLALAVAAASVGTSAANIALPAITDSFGSTIKDAQWVVLAYLLGLTAASVVVGALGDRVGRRRVLNIGTALFVLSAMVAALSASFATLIAARLVQGAAASAMTALPLAIARDVGARERLGRTMGLLGTSSAIGTAFGPGVGGALVSVGGWQAPFWAMVVLGLLPLALLGFRPAPAGDGAESSRFDAIGAGLLVASVATLTVSLGLPDAGWRAAPLAAVGLVLAALFVFIEQRAIQPVLPLGLLRTRATAIGLTSNVIVAAVMMTTLVVGPFVLHEGLGLSAPIVGLVMAVGPVTSAVSGALVGRLVDGRSMRWSLVGGLGLMTVGTLALAALPGLLGAGGYIIGLLILTPGYQLFLAANSTHLLSSADTEHRGTTAGLLGLSRNIGLITGTAAMAGLYAGLTAAHPTSAQTHLAASQTVLSIAAAIAAAGLGLSLLVRTNLTSRKEIQ